MRKSNRPPQEWERELRDALRARFPEEIFFFQAANITNQILNFGIPSAIDVQVVGRNEDANYKIARNLERRIAGLTGAVDVHLRQEVAAPAVRLMLNRVYRSVISPMIQRLVAESYTCLVPARPG